MVRQWAVSLLVILSAACARREGPSGTYQLTAVNGVTLPAGVVGDTCNRIVAGDLTLAEDATWRATMLAHQSCGSTDDTSRFAGRYSKTEAAFKLVVDSFSLGGRPTISGTTSDTLSGTVQGARITLTYQGWSGSGEPPVVFSLLRQQR